VTQFNPQNKGRELTYGEIMDPIFNITEPQDAQQYLEAYCRWLEYEYNNPPEEAEFIAKSNIGYWAAYGSRQDRERIEELFDCEHPVFGSVKENGHPTPQQAFEAGKALAEKYKKEQL
jgi:hypothetical protein